MAGRPPMYVRNVLRRTYYNQVGRSRRHYATANSNPEIYDVVCVGGGPAGLSLMSALRAKPETSSLRLGLIESQDLAKSRLAPTTPPTWYSNRCSSLTPTSVRYLQEIGVWDHVKQSRVQPYSEMQVWDGVSGSRISFDWGGRGVSTTPGGQTIAYMIENLNLTNALLSRLDELKGVDIFSSTKVENITLGPSPPPASAEPSTISEPDSTSLDLSTWPTITLSNGATLSARLLIGADGFNSPVRHFSGIQSLGWDYNRHGVVATLKLAHPPTGPVTAYQRFLPTGPIALLPLPSASAEGQEEGSGYATLVWSTLPQHASLLKTLSPEDFTATVNAGFRLSTTDLKYLHSIPRGQAEEVSWRLRHTPQVGKLPTPIAGVQEGSVASFPLRMRHASTYTTSRLALLGDAAHTIHPLAGQGLNLGQGDVASLARVIAETVKVGGDIGSSMALEGYTAERYAGNGAMMGVCDKLHKVYAAEGGPVVWARSLGLDVVDRLGPLKGLLMKRASGTGLGVGVGF